MNLSGAGAVHGIEKLQAKLGRKEADDVNVNKELDISQDDRIRTETGNNDEKKIKSKL